MRRFVFLSLALTLTLAASTPAFARRGVFRQRTVIRGGGFGGGAVVVPGQSFAPGIGYGNVGVGAGFSPVGGIGTPGYGVCGNNVGAAFIPMQQQIQYVPVQSAVVGNGCNNVGAAFAPVATPYSNVGVGLAPVGGIGGARVFRQRTVIRGW